MKLYLDLLQSWTGCSEILDNIATVVKHFKRLLNVHKSDEFNGKMSVILDYHAHVVYKLLHYPNFLNNEIDFYRWCSGRLSV